MVETGAIFPGGVNCSAGISPRAIDMETGKSLQAQSDLCYSLFHVLLLVSIRQQATVDGYARTVFSRR